MKLRKQMPSGALAWYYIACIFTFGTPYFAKIIIMKAMVDSQTPEVQYTRVN